MDARRLCLSVLVVCLHVRVKDVCAWSGTGGAGGCPEPSPVANAFWTLTETANGTSVVYTCVDGYQLTAGSLTRVCNVNYAVFDEKPPICTLNCGAPRAITVTTNNATSFLAHSLVGYTCAQNYWVPSTVDSSVYCDPVSGQWEGNHYKLLCRADISMVSAIATQNPDPSPNGNWSADLALDNNVSTCSSTGGSTNPTWSVHFSNSSTDVAAINVVLRVPLDQVPALTLRADVLGGVLQTCGRLNMSKAMYSNQSSTLTGTIHCSGYPSKPDGRNITLSALFEGGAAVGTLQLCEVKVKGAPHTATCNFPPRIPRLKLAAGGTVSFFKQDTVRYVCEDGFTPLNGSGDVTCGLDSQWSAPSLHCTDEEDRTIPSMTTVAITSTTVQVTLQLSGHFEIYGVYIHPKTLATVTVRTAAGKTCGETMYSDDAMYIACPLRPKGSGVTITLPATQYDEQSQYKVFGRPYESGLECLQTDLGVEYKGKLNVTRTGYSCRSWADQNVLSFTADDFADNSVQEASNFCRNPAGSKQEPWCFVDDPDVYWETCQIFHCAQFCKMKDDGSDYRGSQDHTVRGNECDYWSSASQPFLRPLDFSDADTEHRACRNPGRSQSSPWCFVTAALTHDPDIEGPFDNDLLNYEHCDIPDCPTGVDIISKTQSQLSGLGGRPTLASVGIRECHTSDVWHFAPTSWLRLATTVCHNRADGETAVTLCRSAASQAAGGANTWAYFVILCDGNDAVSAPTTAAAPDTSEVTEAPPSSPAPSVPAPSSFSGSSTSSSWPAMAVGSPSSTAGADGVQATVLAVSSPSSTAGADGIQATDYSSVFISDHLASLPPALAARSDRSDDVLDASAIAVEMVTSTGDISRFTSYFSSSSGSAVGGRVSSSTVGIMSSSVETPHSSASGSAALSSHAQPSRQCCPQSEEYSSLEHSDLMSIVASVTLRILSHDGVLTTSLTKPSSHGTQQNQPASGITISVSGSSHEPATSSTPDSSSSLQPPTTVSPQCGKACTCRFVDKAAVSERLGSSDLEEMRRSIQRELSVETSNLSRTIRKKTSATDNRPSVVTVGSLGLGLLSATFLLVCAGDVLDAIYRNKAALVVGHSKT